MTGPTTSSKTVDRCPSNLKHCVLATTYVLRGWHQHVGCVPEEQVLVGYTVMGVMEQKASLYETTFAHIYVQSAADKPVMWQQKNAVANNPSKETLDHIQPCSWCGRTVTVTEVADTSSKGRHHTVAGAPVSEAGRGQIFTGARSAGAAGAGPSTAPNSRSMTQRHGPPEGGYVGAVGAAGLTALISLQHARDRSSTEQHDLIDFYSSDLLPQQVPRRREPGTRPAGRQLPSSYIRTGLTQPYRALAANSASCEGKVQQFRQHSIGACQSHASFFCRKFKNDAHSFSRRMDRIARAFRDLHV